MSLDMFGNVYRCKGSNNEEFVDLNRHIYIYASCKNIVEIIFILFFLHLALSISQNVQLNRSVTGILYKAWLQYTAWTIS